MAREGNVGIMDEKAMKELYLRNRIRDFVNQEDAFKNFDAKVKARVLGQKNLSQITYNVFMWLRGLADRSDMRNNAMIVAPSGCGKTETYRTIKEILSEEIANIPVVQLDATRLTAEGYKGMDIKDFFEPLFTDSINGIAIIVIDEIDKRLIPDICSTGENVNASIQSQLLTLIEGTELKGFDGEDDVIINTANTLFIAAGAFQSIRDKRKEARMKNASNTMSIGFHSTPYQNAVIDMPLDEDITLEEIIENGAMHEFMGRFPTIINLHMLDFDSVKTIVNRYISEYGKLLKCQIIFEDNVVKELYEKYRSSSLGCRILRNQVWNRISPIGMEIERKNFANKDEDIKIICATRGDMYTVSNKVYKLSKKEHAA